MATALVLCAATIAGCAAGAPPALPSPGGTGSLAASAGDPAPTAAPGSAAAPATAAPAGNPPDGSTTAPGATFPPDLAAMLQRTVDRARTMIPSPGLAVAVRLPDGTAWTGVSGSRSLSPDRPVDEETVFAIASITKTFVTAVVLQLVDEGKLRLDDRLADHVPDFPRADRITIRQLLGHTSGIADYFQSADYLSRVFVDRDRTWTTDEILAMAGDPVCDPGACFEYSNTNFVLLGLVAEDVTGIPLSRAIRKRLLDPLGLDRIVFQPDEKTPRDYAHGHLWGGGRSFFDQSGKADLTPHLSAVSVAWAAGAMAADAPDLARWAEALYGGDVLSPRMKDEMLTFRKRDDYGLGTRRTDFLGHRAVGHLGGIRGFCLAMWYFPDDGVTIVVLANRGIFDTYKTVKLVARRVLEGEDDEAGDLEIERAPDRVDPYL